MSDRGLAQAMLDGDRRALSRAIRRVEDRASGAADIVAAVYPSTGRARTIGVTGPPGVGKSTLVDRVIEAERAQKRTVAVVAIDPSSPLTGGAILGDRIRMGRHWEDAGVFVRSMASRGHLGGIARASRDVMHLLDGFGFDTVIVETVGVGQAEVAVASATMSTVVVLAPGLGDSIQFMKAGLIEVGDVLVVNQADRDGVDALMSDLVGALELVGTGYQPAVLPTVGTTGEGIAELQAALAEHREWLNGEGRLEAFRFRAAEEEVRDAIATGLVETGLGRGREDVKSWISRAAAREVTVRDVVREFLRPDN